MRFEVRNGDSPVYGNSNTQRSEVSSKNHLAFGQTYTLSYKFMIEPGTKSTSDWVIIGQAHATEDAGEGGASPPFAIELANGEKMRIVARSSNADVTSSSNIKYMNLYQDSTDLVRGQWYDMKITVKFDPAGNGMLDVWRDGKQIVDYTGAIGYKDQTGPYWKEGIYREHAPETLAVKYTALDVVTGTGSTSTTPPPTSTTPPLTSTPEASTPTSTPTTTNTINGTNSYDDLKGTLSNDKIDGLAHNDILRGMLGNDVLTGGTGKDWFNFDTKLGSSNIDTITDFNVADDSIRFNDAVFTKLSVGTLSSRNFRIGEKAMDSDDYVIYNNKTGALSYDADGSGAGAAIQFAKVNANLMMTAADFIIY
ncbi:heparin lyase I family protein [Microvirga sp. BT689]|uniref:heparin lyase I family protein n=1 Tax=Microvirga arvi TaxID=2778731 RepID=UPI0019517EBD|nr:heparin lyase I family protein [Microvirga arvi]